MDNVQFKIVLELLTKLYNNSKVYGAFIFGSRSRNMETDDSDYDIALFTDLDFFELSENFYPLCYTSDICSLNNTSDFLDYYSELGDFRNLYVSLWRSSNEWKSFDM